MRRDIASAYLAAATKIGSWVVISALIFRWYGATLFAMVALARGTLSILNYTTLGLAPAIIHTLARGKDIPAESSRTDVRVQPIHTILATGLAIGTFLAIVVQLIVGIYSENFFHFHQPPVSIFFDRIAFTRFVALLGAGLILRLFSDIPGAVLQTKGLIAFDNLLIAASDVVWIVLTMIRLEPNGSWSDVVSIGTSFGEANALLFAERLIVAALLSGRAILYAHASLRVARLLLSFGGLLAIAQLADYLYAPIDFVLINGLLDPVLAAVYSPAVQIDAGMLLLVGGVASVLLPKTAIAHAAGNRQLIRKYYIRGTIFTGGLLTLAGVSVWLLSPWIFRLWLHDPMTATQAILPLVLVHTVVGGSSAVGRSVLLGMGKVRPFTIAVLAAGVANVILSYCFVRYAGLGLKGIILGTIVVVIARCAIWQPWYVLRTLGRSDSLAATSDPDHAQTMC
jgi:O-antigen/teichoic acid export membrane protein